MDENDIKNSEEKKNEHVEVDHENSITNSINQLSDNFMKNDSSNEDVCQNKTLHIPGKLKFFFFAQP